MKKTLYIICLAFAVISCDDISKKIETVTEESSETPITDSANVTDETTLEEVSPETPKTDVQILVDKIVGVDWKSEDTGVIITFDNPTREGYGEFHDNVNTFFCKYEISNGILNMRLYKYISDGNETPVDSSIAFPIRLKDNDNTLVLNSSIYKRN